MNDEQLSELLRSLPRHDSSAGFTARVVSRMDEQMRKPARFPWALATALVSFVTVAGLTGQHFIEKQQQKDRVEAFRAEQQRIADELDQLRQLAEEREPVIYLSGSEEAEYVLDLRAVEFDPRTYQTASYPLPR